MQSSTAEAPLGLRPDQLLVQKNVQHNVGVVNFIGVFGSLVAGLAAGICGVTGWNGFLFYFAMQIVVAVLVLTKAKFQTQLYFPSWLSMTIGEAFSSTMLLTFILFWTISHNYIHLFQ